jgi:hypothetical protein
MKNTPIRVCAKTAFVGWPPPGSRRITSFNNFCSYNCYFIKYFKLEHWKKCDNGNFNYWYNVTSESRGSSVSIVSDYGLDDRAIGVRSPAGAKGFSCSFCVHTGSEAHPVSSPLGTKGPFPGGKLRPRRDADHSPHLVPRAWMSRSHISSSPKCLHGVKWDSFTFITFLTFTCMHFGCVELNEVVRDCEKIEKHGV